MQPTNAFTGSEYKGGNIAALQSNYKSNKWAGFDQWQKLGRQVSKGQHGRSILVVFTDKSGEQAVKRAVVFNYEQTDVLDNSQKLPKQPQKPLESFKVYNTDSSEFIEVKGRTFDQNGYMCGYFKNDSDAYIVVELSSGAMIASQYTLEGAKTQAAGVIQSQGGDQLDALIDKHIANHGRANS